MIEARDELLAALREAMRAVAPDQVVPAAFQAPKLAAHGDLACTAAMALAKPLRKNPREVATALITALHRQPAVARWVDSMEIAGPGFINFQLKPATRQAVVREVLTSGVHFGGKRLHSGRADANGDGVTRNGVTGDGVTGNAAIGDDPIGTGAQRAKDRVIVEFVSANPTGPLHVGHARQAALGDAICNLLETQGHAVTREFYYNDAGVQIATLGASTQLRVRGLKPGDAAWDAVGSTYAGDYVADIAADFMAGATVRADDRAFTGSADADDVAGMREFAVAYLRHEQDLDLQAFGVRFDSYFLESSLYTTGRVDDTVQRLVRSGHTYEADGALWLRSTDYGDDKDRVMRKSDGTYTYFVPDVAYHLAKFERGFHHAINIQGGDHHGTVARVRAGLQAADMGVPADYPSYVLHKMVTVMKGGEEVKISKRAGSYVTLRDLIDWTSRDAVRFFLLSRKADTEFTFDVDLALKQNDENPVFYVQYAHARICSVLRQFTEQGGTLDALVDVELGPLVSSSEVALMRKLADYPGLLETAARNLAPHEVAFYLRDVAAAFHSYYAAERFLVDDPHLQRARLALLAATAQVIRNALTVLGVSAPERMARELPAATPATTAA